MRTLLALAIVIAPTVAAADVRSSVDIQLNQAGQMLANDLGIDIAELEDSLSTQLRELLGLAPVGGFLRTFSNATSFSNRGIGVDYANSSERGMIGAAINASVATDLDGEVPAAGGAANLTLMGGYNLRRFGWPQVTAYANAFWQSTKSADLKGSIASAGAHLQYRMFHKTEGWKRMLAQWGGIDITTGLELARWTVGLRGEMKESIDVGDSDNPMETIDASIGGNFDLSSTTLTVPVEATTSLRLLYIASLYAGVGVDAQVGSTKVDVGAQGRLASSTGEDLGSLSVSGQGSRGPSILGWHALLGLQVNMGRLKVFTQATVDPIEKLSLALGVRVVL